MSFLLLIQIGCLVVAVAWLISLGYRVWHRSGRT